MNRLKYERLDRGITQKGLEYLSRVPQPVICLIENGRWNPNPQELAALARVLGVQPPVALLAEMTPPEPKPEAAPALEPVESPA